MEVYINDFDDLGNGISRIENKVCFVKSALPKELVDIKIIKENKNYSTGEIVNIIKKSELRIEPICKYYNECGGCNFLHLVNGEEINFKKRKIMNYFNKLDNFYTTKNYNYRNKIVLHVKNGIIGFYKEKTNDLIEIKYCYLVKEKINKIISLLNQYKDSSFCGSITLRVNSSDESLVSIEGNYKYIDNLSNSNLIDNLIYNDKVLKGNDYFYEIIDNYKFKVNYKSFFQVNILGLLAIIKILKEFFKDKNFNTALELYSGTSVLGILISSFVSKVTSIEVNENATRDALHNVKINNIKNLKVINGLVEDNINKFHDIDFILVDPARRGLDKKTIKYLKEIKSKYLIYIACGIDSLKRDLVELNESYQVDNIYGIDMFPCTNNVECIALLSHKKT
ncbi:MAG: class I SAM-dependent RNA methyltransferase [Bacilli bacterium]|nr:class I SAM-dependent RNA methyltransferase [Bacilli bacterium]